MCTTICALELLHFSKYLNMTLNWLIFQFLVQQFILNFVHSVLSNNMFSWLPTYVHTLKLSISILSIFPNSMSNNLLPNSFCQTFFPSIFRFCQLLQTLCPTICPFIQSFIRQFILKSVYFLKYLSLSPLVHFSQAFLTDFSHISPFYQMHHSISNLSVKLSIFSSSCRIIFQTICPQICTFYQTFVLNYCDFVFEFVQFSQFLVKQFIHYFIHNLYLLFLRISILSIFPNSKLVHQFVLKFSLCSFFLPYGQICRSFQSFV